MPDVISDLLQTKSTFLADVSGPPERLLVRSDLTGTMQLYELAPPGEPVQLTAFDDPVGNARYLPGARRCVLEVDSGGNERHQIYVLDLDSRAGPRELGQLRALTDDPRYGNHLAGVSPDGAFVAYVSNRANGVDFDLWLCDLATGEHDLLLAAESWLQPASGFSPDGKWISVKRPGPRPLDEDLLLVDARTGDVTEILPHPDEAALVGGPQWIDDTTFYVSSNIGSDMARVVRFDVASGEHSLFEALVSDWDCEPVTSRDGSALAVIENANGVSQMTCFRRGGSSAVVLAEPGVVVSHLIRPPVLSDDGSTLYFTLSTPRRAGDVWAHDVTEAETRQLTESPAPVAPDGLVEARVEKTTSFDGESIPLFVFEPVDTSGGRVVVLVHGGPESQSVLSFNPMIQALAASGFAVVVPNVRGSTGYGKRYASLDDTVKRLDSVRDLATVHSWLSQAGFDRKRAALWGGSYGGYMVLAGLAFQPDLWAAGVDIVGISDLETFLKNTSDYRRAHREREYGSLARDREFLASASPLRHVEDMKAPLFVIHGENDPRVPVTEARQLVANLEKRHVRCELLVYGDEGHGLARLANKLDAYPRAVSFLEEVL